MNGVDNEDAAGPVVLGGLRVVCFHNDFWVVVKEYVLDKVVCGKAEAFSVGNVHELYTPRKALL